MELVKLDAGAAEDFCRLRMALFRELGEIGADTDISRLLEATKEYYLSHIGRDLVCWGIRQAGELAAIGALCLFSRLPYEENLTGVEGYILSIYTQPPFRGRGFAGKLLDAVLEYAKSSHIRRLWLNSSPGAKALYGGRGFRAKENEMELYLQG